VKYINYYLILKIIELRCEQRHKNSFSLNSLILAGFGATVSVAMTKVLSKVLRNKIGKHLKLAVIK